MVIGIGAEPAASLRRPASVHPFKALSGDALGALRRRLFHIMARRMDLCFGRDLVTDRLGMAEVVDGAQLRY